MCSICDASFTESRNVHIITTVHKHHFETVQIHILIMRDGFGNSLLIEKKNLVFSDSETIDKKKNNDEIIKAKKRKK